MAFITKKQLKDKLSLAESKLSMYKDYYFAYREKVDLYRDNAQRANDEIRELKSRTAKKDEIIAKQSVALSTNARTIKDLNERIAWEQASLDTLKSDYQDLKTNYSNLLDKFRVVDNAIGRVTKQRDTAQLKLDEIRERVDSTKSDVEFYCLATEFLSSLLSHIINGYSNGKRILIKEKELEGVLKTVEGSTGLTLQEICDWYKVPTEEETE